MTGEEYNRLWPIIHGRLTKEEKQFWAKTAALNCEAAHKQEQMWRSRARFWQAVAGILLILFGVLPWTC